MQRWIDKSVIFVLVVAIAIDGFAILRLRVVTAQALASMYSYNERPGAISPPNGFTAKLARVDPPEGRDVGWAVRYISKDCSYCSSDAQWNRLAPELQQLGYQIMIVLPNARDAYSDNAVVPLGIPQEAYIDMDWIGRIRLSMTPTLLIFSPDHRLIWYRKGILSQSDPEAAIKTISTLKSR
jgi:hypothetical protein